VKAPLWKREYDVSENDLYYKAMRLEHRVQGLEDKMTKIIEYLDKTAAILENQQKTFDKIVVIIDAMDKRT
jgi:chaperonin cofactor prefoldin